MQSYVGYLHALSSSLHHCHGGAQRIANMLVLRCQVQCYLVVSLSALGQYKFNVFMMRCVAKLLLNMSRRRKKLHPCPPLSPFTPTTLLAAVCSQHRVQSCCYWPTRCAELCLLCLRASRIRTIVVILIFVCRFEPLSIGSHRLNVLARVASRSQFANDCRMTAATGTGQRALSSGHWVPGHG